jgi:hypothetical protein
MRLIDVRPAEPGVLVVVSEDGRTGRFDVRPYFSSPAFRSLTDECEFRQVRNGGYYIEWPCGADLSADTIEARWIPTDNPSARATQQRAEASANA